MISLDFTIKVFSFTYREGFVESNEDEDLATLLTSHISSNVSLSSSVVLVIRRSMPWKSFLREMTCQKVDDTMDFEVTTVMCSFYQYHREDCKCLLLSQVKFSYSMRTVDDKGP